MANRERGSKKNIYVTSLKDAIIVSLISNTIFQSNIQPTLYVQHVWQHMTHEFTLNFFRHKIPFCLTFLRQIVQVFKVYLENYKGIEDRM